MATKMTERKVFINRTLNMKRITHIGLDMDHTLVRYNSFNFETLAHKMMLDRLVSLLNYPKSILKLKFDYELAIRGLVIDKSRGNILKLSRYAAIRTSYHGTEAIDYETQNKIYKSTYIDLGDTHYDKIDTAFSISFATLFAQLVDLKDGAEFKNLPDYSQIAFDLNYTLDLIHRDGSLKSVVRENLSEYILKDKEIVAGLERYIKHGKKIFILTNSDFHYTKLLLDYAITPFLENHDSWLDLFELVITSAQKPRFFYDKLNFLKINPADGSMTNVANKLAKGVYQGGCASILTNDLGLAADEILYVGDHIYGDIVRLKKDCAWRTALVVEEIEDEIAKNLKAAPITAQINNLMEKKMPLEAEIDSLVSMKIEQGKAEDQQIKNLMNEVSKIDKEISPLIKKVQTIFNPYWGEVMRAGIEESYFAYQVERFACIYMAKLTDLLNLSPRTYFRSPRRRLAHDPVAHE